MTTEHALARVDDIARHLTRQAHVICLDYDGTLTPIRPSPPEAVLGDEMRKALVKLAEQSPVAIVTGRELSDARQMVDIDLIYAASHGFELKFPDEPAQAYEPAEAYREAISDTADSAEEGASDIEGVMIERKPFSTAVHFRKAAPEDMPKVSKLVAELQEQHPGLRVLQGKKVSEFQPRIDWDKGRAVALLAERLEVPLEGVLYIGDDVTDEDAFRAIAGKGIGILVNETDRETAAQYRLDDPDEVRVFLKRLAEALRGAA
ncbi:trehalose-phosphatase [Dichotomicrobium thermohalophilum]|uniref:Trehalose 6-phosphate phosphatase n=1 Tax=Dichotomicrobium thermohalophilum TaxID=933063 RepID=A0A397PF33_9HYPH|nr:trehalose-phosphatase [Dichotomicrobium thermohalophilum]RIA47622.1 trehalose 6-phosphatase [Dichotomicrobium thermohalophilum]